MKTVVKIDPDKEYESAKQIIQSMASDTDLCPDITTLESSVDNLKTVINILIDRATSKKRTRPPKKSKKKKPKGRTEFNKLPSLKFPDLEVKETIIRNPEPPQCSSCQRQMVDSGLFKTSEKLEVIPKQYYIIRHKRAIYCCASCRGDMQNAAAKPSICRSSNYGDSIIIDVSLSKYCDLLPIERYCAMAAREGLVGLPPNSLIGITHQLADFLSVAYRSLKAEVQNSEIILMDETPHRMLEGDATSNWYLWGFSSAEACVFEAHPTRSGDIPLKFLQESQASHLLTDGYSGYKKAVRMLKEQGKKINEVYCNAHAYRYFDEASTTWADECQPFQKIYGEIYDLERNAESDLEKSRARKKMGPLFDDLLKRCGDCLENVMPSSSFEKAINYFQSHFVGLSECVKNIKIPLTNNSSERLIRSPVIGRKTWYGTHSKRGARTNAIIFSLVESCKLCGINPRNYFLWASEQIHKKSEILTPSQYATKLDSG